MIPNKIHFIFGLAPDFGGKPFSFVHYLAVLSAAIVNRPETITIHCAHEPDNRFWAAAKEIAQVRRVDPPAEIFGRPLLHYAHKADVLRLLILQREGGIYLDLDTFCVRPFAPLRQHATVMGIEPHAGLGNAVILSEPNAEFIRVWLEAYRAFDPSRWNDLSVRMPYRLAQQNPAAIRVEDPYAFFFPSYDDPMRQWLWQDALGVRRRSHGFCNVLWRKLMRSRAQPTRAAAMLRHVVASKAWYYDRLRKSYCIHLWETLWWDRYLSRLDPATLRTSEGMFARLVADVLPEEAFSGL